MVTYEQWPWMTAPNYVDGSSYLISGTAIGPLVAAAQVTPFFQPNGSSEDVYVTGILTEVANVTLRFASEKYKLHFYMLCSPFYDFCFKISFRSTNYDENLES